MGGKNLTADLLSDLCVLKGGHCFGSGWNRLTDNALGGWRLSGDAILYSGFPIKIWDPDPV